MKVTSTFDHTHPIIIKVILIFLNLYQHEKISSIDLFIHEIQQILDSYVLKDHTIFNQAHPIIIIITFSRPESVSPSKKPDYSINLLRYSQF